MGAAPLPPPCEAPSAQPSSSCSRPAPGGLAPRVPAIAACVREREMGHRGSCLPVLTSRCRLSSARFFGVDAEPADGMGLVALFSASCDTLAKEPESRDSRPSTALPMSVSVSKAEAFSAARSAASRACCAAFAAAACAFASMVARCVGEHHALAQTSLGGTRGLKPPRHGQADACPYSLSYFIYYLLAYLLICLLPYLLTYPRGLAERASHRRSHRLGRHGAASRRTP